jgi:hypothetical protein
MIRPNKIFRAHSGCWDYDSTNEPKYSKNHFFFMLNRTKIQIWRINLCNKTHLRIYGRKIISRHFQLVRISYQKLDFHRISRFSAVFIINNLNVSRYKSGTMDTRSLFRLISFNRSDKKKHQPTLALVCSLQNLIFLFGCPSKIFSFINAMKIPSIS